MTLSVRPSHLRRYRDLAWLLWKYGRSDLVKQAGLEEVLQEELQTRDDTHPPDADELARDLEAMGPTFVKLGQLLSTRADLLPPAYLGALARLQDAVEPFSFAEVEQIVTDELGIRLRKVFADFEERPLAAASLGQVHRARLRHDGAPLRRDPAPLRRDPAPVEGGDGALGDNGGGPGHGRTVAVKVQRPGIRGQIVEDLEALEEVAALIDAHTELGQRWELGVLIGEFRKSVMRELDYREEAQNLVTLAAHLERFDRLVVPRPVDGLVTSRVLTMEYVGGTKVTDVSPLALMDVDANGLAAELFAAYLEQILVHGFFHADPHPGNVLLTGDGRLALLDLGMTARLPPRLQDRLLQLVLALSEGRAEDVADLARELGEPRPDFDARRFNRGVADVVTQTRDASLRELQVGRILLEVTRLAGSAGLRPPPELMMLGKTLLHLDEIARALDPEFDPNVAIRRHASRILQRRLLGALSPASLMSGALETKDLVERLPARLNRILDRLAGEDLRLRIEGFDQTKLVAGVQKIANRITLGLVLAALIIGAAMLMQIETPFRLFGYPGLAIVLFLVAAAGGVALIVSILLGDE